MKLSNITQALNPVLVVDPQNSRIKNLADLFQKTQNLQSLGLNPEAASDVPGAFSGEATACRAWRTTVWCLVGNGGMDIGDYYWGLYRDPFPHSLLRTKETTSRTALERSLEFWG